MRKRRSSKIKGKVISNPQTMGRAAMDSRMPQSKGDKLTKILMKGKMHG